MSGTISGAPGSPSSQGIGVAVRGEADKGLQRVRSRSSYRLFRELYEFLRDEHDIAIVLRRFYEVLDARGGFGSRRNAAFAAESLGQVLKDMGHAAKHRQDAEVL